MSIIRILLATLTVTLVACSGGSDTDTTTDPSATGTPDANIETTTPGNATTSTPTHAATGEPAQNADGVWHHICPNGCEGGSGSAGVCEKCGTTLQHNAAYHSNNAAASTTITPDGDGSSATPPPARTPEPAQNANGVWHYICSAGCEGGAGSATACAGCGGTLTHNTAYHQ